MWGRAKCNRELVSNLLVFQFTPPCGGEPGLAAGTKRDDSISIHAPVWGRAQTAWANLQIAFIFQFTPPYGGGRLPTMALTSALTNFNSRPRMGAGWVWMSSPRPKAHFNSRPRMGAGGHFSGRLCRAAAISIHAPVWGRGPEQFRLQRWLYFISIHAPVWGRGVRTAALWPDDG